MSDAPKPATNESKFKMDKMNESIDGFIGRIGETEYGKKANDKLTANYSKDMFTAAFIGKMLLFTANLVIMSSLSQAAEMTLYLIYIVIFVTFVDGIIAAAFYLKRTHTLLILSAVGSFAKIAFTLLIILLNIFFSGITFFISSIPYILLYTGFEILYLLLSRIKLSKSAEEGEYIKVDTSKENEIKIEV